MSLLMANCTLCGRPAGWFRSSHEECSKLHQKGSQAILQSVSDAVFLQQDFEVISGALRSTARNCLISSDRYTSLLKSGINAGCERLLTEKGITTETFTFVEGFGNAAGIIDEELTKLPGHRLAFWGSIVSGVVDGCPVDCALEHPFNLDDEEVAVIAIGQTIYAKESVDYQRHYGGLSVPVGGGVRAYFGSSQGQSSSGHYLREIDSGDLLLTTQNLYFRGSHMAFRLPHDEILSLQPYSDGLGIFRDSNSTEEVFIVKDPNVPRPGDVLHKLVSFLISPDGRALYA